MRKIWLVISLAVMFLVAGCLSTDFMKPKETAPDIPVATPAPEHEKAPMEGMKDAHAAHEAGEGIPEVNPFKGDAAAIKAGKEIYQVNCMPCHGSNGKGTGLPNQPDFTNATWWAGEEDSHLFKAVSEGVPGTAMPAWKDLLSKDEIWKVLAYENSFRK